MIDRKIKYDYFEFKKLYQEHNGNISKLAMILSKERPTIRNWIDKMMRDEDLVKKACSEETSTSILVLPEFIQIAKDAYQEYSTVYDGDTSSKWINAKGAMQVYRDDYIEDARLDALMTAISNITTPNTTAVKGIKAHLSNNKERVFIYLDLIGELKK